MATALSPWKDEKVCARVKELWANHSASQIADAIREEFGIVVSRNAIVGRLHRERLTLEHKATVHPMTRGRKRGPKPHPKPTSRVRGDNPQRASVILTREPVKISALRCVEVEPRNLSFAEMADDASVCKYPLGDEAPFTFCGHPKTAGSNYCMPHFALCLGAGTTSERAATRMPALVA